jgi:Alpha-galactosidase
MIEFSTIDFGMTCFEQSGKDIALRELFGMKMHSGNEGAPCRLKGSLDIFTSLGALDDTQSKLLSHEKTEDALTLKYSYYGGALEHKSVFTFDKKQGICRRQDSLRNLSNEDIILYRAQPKFQFSSGQYQTYTQTSVWCYENDGAWSDITTGIYLQNEGARTTQGNTPFIALRDTLASKGAAFHILPMGNWSAELSVSSSGVGSQAPPLYMLKLGHSANDFAYRLHSEESFTMPELLIQALPDGNLHTAAPNLHSYLLKAENAEGNKILPQKVVYNPWFDCYDHIELKRLRERLCIAKEIGCEVFSVDAGWYGRAADWSQSAGDWREKLDGAFYGKLRDFADEVRTAGLDFGLWMEPERVGPDTPIRAAHPEWFAYGSSGFYYPKLWIDGAYQYLKSEILRLIDDYALKWMKIDFNFELERDETNTGFYLYYQNWYRLVREVKTMRPEVFLESCSSGGLRSDISTMSAFDCQFVCDNINPWDSQIMFEQMSLRTLHSKLYRWIAVQKGPDIPAYFREESDVEETVVTPASPGAGFADSEIIDLDFACKLAFAGMCGISGDIATLRPNELAVIRENIEFYKKHRDFLRQSTLQLLTEPQKIGKREHWSIMQYTGHDKKECLIYAYRFNHLSEEKRVQVKNFDPAAQYKIDLGKETFTLSGKELAVQGFTVKIEKRNRAKVISVVQTE